MKDFLFEELQIELTEVMLNDIGKQNIDQLWSDIILHKGADLKTMLGGYYYDSRGSVDGITIKQQSIHITSAGSGSVRLTYVVNYNMACADVSYDDRQEMKIDFIIDQQKKIIHLSGERIPLRGPDEL